MRKSISFLPKHKQEEIKYIVSLILEHLPQTEMIILFGSHARNEYVDYDSEQYSKVSKKVSDYDILVATNNISDKDAGKTLDNIEDIWYGKGKDNPRQVPVYFINESIKNLNKALEERRYFHTEIKEQGILLYDSGNFKLARKRNLKYSEIKKQAEGYFDIKFKKANSFLKMFIMLIIEKIMYRLHFIFIRLVKIITTPLTWFSHRKTINSIILLNSQILSRIILRI